MKVYPGTPAGESLSPARPHLGWPAGGNASPWAPELPCAFFPAVLPVALRGWRQPELFNRSSWESKEFLGYLKHSGNRQAWGLPSPGAAGISDRVEDFEEHDGV